MVNDFIFAFRNWKILMSCKSRGRPVRFVRNGNGAVDEPNLIWWMLENWFGWGVAWRVFRKMLMTEPVDWEGRGYRRWTGIFRNQLLHFREATGWLSATIGSPWKWFSHSQLGFVGRHRHSPLRSFVAPHPIGNNIKSLMENLYRSTYYFAESVSWYSRRLS